VTCSIGIASFPHDGADADTLLRNADTAMYRAKDLGRNNFQLYSAEMNAEPRRAPDAGDRSVERARARTSSSVYYQPEGRARDGRIVGWRRCCAGSTRRRD
jgi:predicted signal transduction protein with EAL and GGDEF domain